MPEQPDPTPRPDVLPDVVASRLLARASELDAEPGDGLAVTDLRVAAAEAGISGRAFDAALAELGGREWERDRAVRASGSAPGRRAPRVAALVGGAVALIAAGVIAFTHALGPTRAALPPLGEPAQVIVRTASGAPGVMMGVHRDGPLFASLGVEPGPDGRRVGSVDLAGEGGTATTPAALEVSGEPGAVTFSAPAGSPELEIIVPGTSLQAHGRAVRLVRDRAGGPLRAEAVPPPAR